MFYIIEAMDPRRCFPCWDEPALKATFSVSVIVPKDRTVIRNLGEIDQSESKSKRMTDIMSFVMG